MDQLELARAAGFFNGEGSTCSWLRNEINKQPYPQIRLSIGNTEVENLEQFQRAVGYGSINGPWSRNGRKDEWKYSINILEDIQYVICDLLWSWLSEEKRNQYCEARDKYLEARKDVTILKRYKAIHGTMSMYNHHKCRCSECLDSYEQFKIKQREAYRARS